MLISPRAVEFVQAKRGAPITIVFVMLMAGRPVSVKEITQVTGYNRDTVTDHLESLTGYVTQIAPLGQRWGRWTLTDKARQLLLPMLNWFEALPGIATATDATTLAATATGEASAVTDIGTDTEFEPGNPYVHAEKFRITRSVVVVDQDLRSSKGADQQQQQTMRKNSASLENEVFKACTAAGIIGDKRDQFTADQWVTPERIRRAVQQAEAEKRWNNPVGMAITRLLNHIEPMTTAQIEKLGRPEERNVGREWQDYIDSLRRPADDQETS